MATAKKQAVKKAPKKAAPVGDVTRTKRSQAHLKRLEEARGKRLVVDLDSSGREALERLLETGYGSSNKEVVIKALVAADSKLKKKA